MLRAAEYRSVCHIYEVKLACEELPLKISFVEFKLLKLEGDFLEHISIWFLPSNGLLSCNFKQREGEMF